MANTINIALTEDVWTDITSTLTDNVVYILQNGGTVSIELFEKSTTPSATDVGITIFPKGSIAIKPQAGFEIYARPDDSKSIAVISEAA